MCDEVVADELRAEPLRGQEQVHRCCVLPAHGIGAGKIQIHLGAPAYESGGYGHGIEGFARLNCGLRVTEPERCGNVVYRDVDMAEGGSHVVGVPGAVGDTACSRQRLARIGGVRGAVFWPGDLRNVDPQDLRQPGSARCGCQCRACRVPPGTATIQTGPPVRRERPVTGPAVSWPARSAARLSHRQAAPPGHGLEWECGDDLTPGRQPALVRGIRIEQHADAHPAKCPEAFRKGQMLGQLRLAVRDNQHWDVVADHLAQQTHGEVVRVTVSELIDAVERQRAGQHTIRRRSRLAGTRHPVLRPNRLTGQALQLGRVNKPDAGRRREDHNLPSGPLACPDQGRNSLRRRGATYHQVQRAGVTHRSRTFRI